MKKENIRKQIQNYASALFQTAMAENAVDALKKDIQYLNTALSDNAVLKQLNSPILKDAQKKESIDFLSKKANLNKITHQFLYILAENKELNLLPEISGAIDDFILEKEGFLKILVETVQPLSATQEKKLKEGLEKKLKKEVILSYKLNENLLGGLILHYHSMEIDDSIRGKLNTLEKLMKGLK